MTTVKSADKLTFHDRLSRLTFLQATKLLGEEGKKLILQGAKLDVAPEGGVCLEHDRLRVTMRDRDGDIVATLTSAPDRDEHLAWSCDRCFRPCEHVGALFSTLLENKVGLGLAAAPPEREPVAALS